jgi:putative ABC transport system permease protein
MIRWESIITALIGATLGMGLGGALALLFTAALSSWHLEIVIPTAELGILVASACVLAVISAAYPAFIAGESPLTRR